MLDKKNTGALIKRAPDQNHRSNRMKMKMLRNTVIDGRIAYVGDVVEVKEKDVPMLLHSQKAKPYPKGDKKTKSVETATTGPKEKAVSRSDESEKDE
jgi:hypothetical protein